MANDRLWVFNKQTNIGDVFGEISSDYSLALNMDKSPSNVKVIIFNLVEDEIEPNTLCYHEVTDTWWVVKKDNSLRIIDEADAYKYRHTINLEEAFELYNVREMNSRGFSKNRYTILQIFDRLFKAAKIYNFELDFSSCLNPNAKNQDNLTYENYMFATALKELCDMYDVIPKLSFATSTYSGGRKIITKHILKFLSKTGNGNPIKSIEESFSDFQEKENSNENFATRVISNVENAMNSRTTAYPLIGSALLSVDNYQFDKSQLSSVYLKLPSKIAKVEKIIRYAPITLGGSLTFPVGYYLDTEENIRQAILIYANFFEVPDFPSYDDIPDNLKTQYRNSLMGFFVREFVSDGEGVYMGHVIDSSQLVYLKHKINRDVATTRQDRIMYWNEADDRILGFEWEGGALLTAYDSATSTEFQDYKDARFNRYKVIYQPLGDIQLSYENENENDDTKLFNQVGKINDAMKVSKLVRGYANELSSSTITRTAIHYDFSELYAFGDVFYKERDGQRDYYIISNISVGVKYVENDGVVLDTIYTLSKRRMSKNSFVSASSRVRDYEIPSKTSIRRVERITDYYEFDYASNPTHEETPHLNLFDFLSFDWASVGLDADFVSIVNIVTDEGIKGFYLDAVAHEFARLTSLIIDFKDNNTFGATRYVDTSTIFTIRSYYYDGLTSGAKRVQVPANYTNSLGEFNSATFYYLSDEEFAYAVNAFDSLYYGERTGLPYINKPFLDTRFFDVVAYMSETTHEDIAKRKVEFAQDKKDALEIPVMQHDIQFGNNEQSGIAVGDNFLMKKITNDNELFVYAWKELSVPAFADEHTLTNITLPTQGLLVAKINRFCKVTLNNSAKTLTLKLYDENPTEINKVTHAISGNALSTSILGKNIAIIRFKVNLLSSTNAKVSDSEEMFLVLNNVREDINANGEVILNINNWKIR